MVPSALPMSVICCSLPAGPRIMPRNRVLVEISQKSSRRTDSFSRAKIVTGAATKFTVPTRMLHDSAPFGTFLMKRLCAR